MWRLPNFYLLRAFEAAARLRSFSLAARELSLTPSAISHQVKDLEASLGCALFVRSPRKVELTPDGRRFYERLSPVLGALQEVCDEAARKPARHGLSVYCSPSFAMKWLGPRLHQFLESHPDISLSLSTGIDAPDLLTHTEIDIAIVYGAGIERPGVVCESLGPERIAPLASPKVAWKIVDLGAQIKSLTLIESPLSPVKWADWCRWNGLGAAPPPRLSMDRAALAIASAVDHLGVALESTTLAARELASGELRELRSPNPVPIERDMHFLCYRESERQSSSLATFRQWMFERFRTPETAAASRRQAAPAA